MSQKLPEDVDKWAENTSQFSKDFRENYNKDSNEIYFLEFDFQFPRKFNKLYKDLPFSPERMEIGKIQQILANFYDKKEYVIYIGNLKELLKESLLKEFKRIID